VRAPIWESLFARTGRESIMAVDPLEDIEGAGVEVEYFAAENPHDRKYICLLETEGRGRVLRRETRYLRSDQGLVSLPTWEGDVVCSPQFIRSQISILARRGLWDERDFISTEESLDGESYVMRAKDARSNKENSIVLFCPEDSQNKAVVRLARHAKRLLSMRRQAFVFRSWLAAMLRN